MRIFVPLMWVFMIGLNVLGISLPGGTDGVLYLFTPDFKAIADPQVWTGAFAQMFFSLSLGLGTMTAYASYLPKDADQVNNSLLVSFMNCGFEYLAGIAIFALLFAFSLNPAGTTLSLSFFVIPEGLAALPWGVKAIGFFFFFLILLLLSLPLLQRVFVFTSQQQQQRSPEHVTATNRSHLPPRDSAWSRSRCRWSTSR